MRQFSLFVQVFPSEDYIVFKQASHWDSCCVRVLLVRSGLVFLGQEGKAFLVREDGREQKMSRSDAIQQLADEGVSSMAIALLHEPKSQSVM